MTRARAAVLDLTCVLLFTLAGRSSHAEALSPAGVWQTAWPFLAGLAAGWLLARLLRGDWPLGLRDAVLVWAVTVGAGMALRAASGQGTDPAFVLVAVTVLAALLLLAGGRRPGERPPGEAGWRSGAGRAGEPLRQVFVSVPGSGSGQDVMVLLLVRPRGCEARLPSRPTSGRRSSR